MAKLTAGYSHVLELGAGTGAVTQALVDTAGVSHLEIVEIQASLVRTLQRKYPTLRIWQEPAHRVLHSYAPRGAAAIVSSLPFKSLPTHVKEETVTSLLRYLGNAPESILIKVTYGLGTPFRVPADFHWRRVRWVFTNLPPACVWVLSKKP
jgi:phospholipid N-methyltransferase